MNSLMHDHAGLLNGICVCSCRSFHLHLPDSHSPVILQVCEYCLDDPRLMDCGHTVCPRCVIPNADNTSIACPHCGDTQAMPERGVQDGLARDLIALRTAKMDATEVHGVECAQCGKPATQTCRECAGGSRHAMCDEHAAQHLVEKRHVSAPIVLEQAVAVDLNMMMACAKHPGETGEC